MIVVSEDDIDIIKGNCTTVIVNYYKPELDINNSTSMLSNDTKVLLIRAEAACYIEDTLITTTFLPISYNPNLNFTQLNDCNVRISPNTQN